MDPYIHTHQDADGTEVITTVSHDLLMISTKKGSTWTALPQGNDAIALAEAILARAGLDSHQIVSGAEMDAIEREAGEAMRDRMTARTSIDSNSCTSRITLSDNVMYRCLRPSGHGGAHQSWNKTWNEGER